MTLQELSMLLRIPLVVRSNGNKWFSYFEGAAFKEIKSFESKAEEKLGHGETPEGALKQLAENISFNYLVRTQDQMQFSLTEITI